MAQILLAAIYVMLSCTAALALKILGVAGIGNAAIAGLVILLALTQIHILLRSRVETRRTRREIAELKRGAKESARALEEMHTKIEEVRSALEAKASAQNRKIVSELQVLEALMRDFAAKISEKARAIPATASEHAERRASAARVELAAFGHSDLLETIRASLEENRVDLYLQSIVSLPQRKLRFYEALS